MSQKHSRENDPDYDPYIGDAKRLKSLENDAKHATTRKIRNIISSKFSEEIQLKEIDLDKIDQNIYVTKQILDQIRAGTTASLHGPDIKEHGYCLEPSSAKSKLQTKPEKPIQQHPNPPVTNKTDEVAVSRTDRFKVRKVLHFGNVSKYIPVEQRVQGDASSHKWMLYVRGPKDSPDIGDFVSKVRFILHPTYKPQDIIDVDHPPFQLVKRGYGEFKARMQLIFRDARNKSVDLVHNLKLDRTCTGLQTLGDESVVELFIFDDSDVQHPTKISSVGCSQVEQNGDTSNCASSCTESSDVKVNGAMEYLDESIADFNLDFKIDDGDSILNRLDLDNNSNCKNFINILDGCITPEHYVTEEVVVSSSEYLSPKVKNNRSEEYSTPKFRHKTESVLAKHVAMNDAVLPISNSISLLKQNSPRSNSPLGTHVLLTDNIFVTSDGKPAVGLGNSIVMLPVLTPPQSPLVLLTYQQPQPRHLVSLLKSNVKPKPATSTNNLMDGTKISTNVTGLFGNHKLTKNCLPTPQPVVAKESKPTNCCSEDKRCEKSAQFPWHGFSSVSEVVRWIVKQNPLVANGVLGPYKYLQARSTEEFNLWPLAKRKSAEWLRAKCVQREMCELQARCGKWKDEQAWSAKQIIKWCRKFGYTPNDSDHKFAKIGNPKSLESMQSTFSLPESLFLKVGFSPDESGQSSLPEDTAEFVDVVEDCAPSTSSSRVPSSILTANLDSEANAVLTNVAEQFLEELLRKCLAMCIDQTGNYPGEISTRNLLESILELPNLEFLTNQNIGKLKVD